MPLIHIPAICFMVGAIISTIYSIDPLNSIKVLPNYIYWGGLIIFLSSHAKNLNFELIANASFKGSITITLYYYLQGYLPDIPILAYVSQNGYAFSMICFTPLFTAHILKSKGKKYALFFLIIAGIIQLTEGRRAGFILVLAGGFSTIYFSIFNIKKIIIILLSVISSMGILSLNIVENILKNANERIYGLIYKSNEIRTNDDSYLTRIAMIKKGQSIYNERPYVGVGLNNFSKFEAKIRTDFIGAELVLKKDTINKTSAHNSYVSLLGEGGLFLLVPFIVLILIVFLLLLYNFNELTLIHRSVFFGFILMLIHLYFISALLNIFAWFLIGLTTAVIYRK